MSVSSPVLRVRTLGTGAADHDWRHIGSPGVRGSAGTLADGRILIDCGVTGEENLTRFGIRPDALDLILISHSHEDHFDPEKVARLIAAKPRIGLVGTPRVIERVRAFRPNLTAHPVTPGTCVAAAGVRVTALAANHAIPDPADQALHYLIETAGGTLLYLLDGAWMLTPTRRLLGRTRVDMVIWDATIGATEGDHRIFEHCDLPMLAHMRRTLERDGVFHAGTVHIADHAARTLWPEDEAAARALAERYGFRLAGDGDEFTFGR